MLHGPPTEANPNGLLIPATVTYAAPTATLVPNSALVPGTTYSATVSGGMDLSGNALAGPLTWSFTTGTPPSCPCDAWNSSAAPKNPSVNDPNAIELGVKFKVDVAGYITGIRFYKGAGNTGTHLGNLWALPAYPNPNSAPGSLLATATFTNETATGWQQVSFSSPVPVTPDTIYVASYFAPNGNYAADSGFFATSGVDNPPVHLLQDGVYGGDGVFSYSATSTYPESTFGATNYWVDVVFTPGWSTGGPGLGVTSSTPTIAQTGVDPLSHGKRHVQQRAQCGDRHHIDLHADRPEQHAGRRDGRCHRQYGNTHSDESARILHELYRDPKHWYPGCVGECARCSGELVLHNRYAAKLSLRCVWVVPRHRRIPPQAITNAVELGVEIQGR